MRDVSAFLGLSVLYLGTLLLLSSSAERSQLVLASSLAPLFIWLSVQDLRDFVIPDIATLMIAVVGVTYLYFTDRGAIGPHIATAFGVTAVFWALGEAYFGRSGQEGLGIGDAKLFGAGSLILGPWQLPEMILLPSLGGIVLYAITRVRADAAEGGIPFGPFIAYAVFTLIFFEPFFL